MKRILPILLALLLLAGCAASKYPETPLPAAASTGSGAESARPESEAGSGETEPSELLPPNTDSVTEPAQPETAPAEPGLPPESDTPDPVPADSDLAIYRQVAADHGAVCGVVFLGFTEWDAPAFSEEAGSWEAFLEASGYGETFPFLKDIPPERILEAGGTEVYCLFPVEDGAAVNVRLAAFDESVGDVTGTDQVLYEAMSGEPFVIRCNVSDIMPNTQVTVMTAQGTLFWEPFLSLEDGRISLPADGSLWDVTPYPG